MHAIIPVKRFLLAKTRLAGHLTVASRAQIARQMVEHVLSQLSGVRGLTQVTVVTSEPAIPELCKRFGFESMPDQDLGYGLNEVLTSALRHLHGEGTRRVLILHADLPRLQKADIESLVTRHGRASSRSDVVLVPDRHDQGTNALICSLPLLFDLQYGLGSFRLHHEAARAQGLRVEVNRIESLAWDVDIIDDLHDLHGSPIFRQESRPPLVADRKYFCR